MGATLGTFEWLLTIPLFGRTGRTGGYVLPRNNSHPIHCSLILRRCGESKLQITGERGGSRYLEKEAGHVKALFTSAAIRVVTVYRHCSQSTQSTETKHSTCFLYLKKKRARIRMFGKRSM